MITLTFETWEEFEASLTDVVILESEIANGPDLD